MAKYQDIFNRRTQFGGSFKGNEMRVNIAGFGSGFLITNLGFNYTAPITRIRELGSPRVYFVDGDGAGTIQIGRVTGPGRSLQAWIRAYSDVTSVAQNLLDVTLVSGATAVLSDAEVNLIFEGVLIQNLGGNVTADGAQLMSMQLGGTFENLLTDEDSGAAGLVNSITNAIG